MSKHVEQLARLVEGAQWDGDCADARRSKEGNDEVRAVGQEDSNARSLADPGGDEPSRPEGGPALDLAVAESLFAVDDELAIGETIGSPSQEGGERAGVVGRRGPDVAVVFLRTDSSALRQT